ncbi:MAG: HAD family hydrolase [Candidatus Omnitrophica bacterium]|nr:HAD family hydrolase [Candidatus Omnitrophota bacterium]
MKIEGILLDIDNTLYDYNKAHESALGSVLDLAAKRLIRDREDLMGFYQKARFQIHDELSGTASSHNRLLYFQRMLELLGINTLKYALEYYNNYWDVFLNNLEVYEDVYNFLDFIKDRKVCLISDLTADIQHRKVQKMKLYEQIKFMVTSEEAGCEKPDARIFLLALKRLNLQPQSVCMIGDDYEKDITGATNLRIRSFWLNRMNEKKQLNELAVEFKNFTELKEYLK